MQTHLKLGSAGLVLAVLLGIESCDDGSASRRLPTPPAATPDAGTPTPPPVPTPDATLPDATLLPPAKLDGATSPPPPSTCTDYVCPAAPVGPFVTIDGKFQTDYGVFYDNADLQQGKREIKKYIVRNHRRMNAGAEPWSNNAAWPLSSPLIIEDLIAEHVTQNPPRACDGTCEANLWIGATAKVKRVVLRDGAWMGLWTGGAGNLGGGCVNSLFEDLDVVDQPHVGIYVEHNTSNTTFRRFRVRSQDTAFISEWWYKEATGNMGGGHTLVLEDFDIRSENGWCINLEAGTYNVIIRRGKLSGYAGIRHPKNLVDPSKPNSIDWATIDTSQLKGPKELIHGDVIGWNGE